MSVLLYVYVFALVFGGLLLGASILLGGHDADVDADGDIDAHLDVDLDAHDGFEASDIGDGANLFWIFRSLRFWTFFLAFFGLSGLAIHAFDLAIWPVGLSIAIGLGLICGYAAVKVFRVLSDDPASRASELTDFRGKVGRVLVEVKPEAVGKVRVSVRGTTVDLLAVASEETLAIGVEAVVVDIEDGRALVTAFSRNSSPSAPPTSEAEPTKGS